MGLSEKSASDTVLDDAMEEQYLRHLDAYGYVVIPQGLPPELTAGMRSLVIQHWLTSSKTKYEGKPERDADDRFVYNLQNKDKAFIDLLSMPVVKSILMSKLNDPFYRFLPTDKPNYILNYYNARSSGQKLDLHIDSYVPNPGPYTTMMQVVFVLEDMNEANGCTVVVPGSHRSGQYTDRELKTHVPLIAKAGDIVLWDSRIWHGTTENASKKSRWALIATFSQWWIKQSMDMPRALPKEIYTQLSDEQKCLIGFCSLPPKNETQRINTKTGYDFLKPALDDYWS